MLQKLGVTPVSLPGGEIFPALQSGAIDGAEWVGPYNDLALGFYQVCRYYYSPGYHEPGPALQLIVNEQAWRSLTPELQAIVRSAADAATTDMYAEYTAQSGPALRTLVQKHGVIVRSLPEDVLIACGEKSNEVLNEIHAGDTSPNRIVRRIIEDFLAFRKDVIPWTRVGEQAFVNARRLPFEFKLQVATSGRAPPIRYRYVFAARDSPLVRYSFLASLGFRREQVLQVVLVGTRLVRRRSVEQVAEIVRHRRAGRCRRSARAARVFLQWRCVREQPVRQVRRESRHRPEQAEPDHLQRDERHHALVDVERREHLPGHAAQVEQRESKGRRQEARLQVHADHHAEPDRIDPHLDQRRRRDRHDDEDDLERVEEETRGRRSPASRRAPP